MLEFNDSGGVQRLTADFSMVSLLTYPTQSDAVRCSILQNRCIESTSPVRDFGEVNRYVHFFIDIIEDRLYGGVVH